MSEDAAPPIIKGFTLFEYRRENCKRGGLATYIKKPLQIEASNGNEFGL
jgi:hypothetical protein